MAKEWKQIKQKRKGSFRVFDVDEITYENPRNGKNVPAFLITCRNWVNVIATTRSGDVILIKQFRFGSNRVELEIPGGTIEDGEDPARAASRELLEETGFAGDVPECIGQVNPNPALHRHSCYTFWIKNVVKKNDPEFDGQDEYCELILEKVSGVKELIKNGTITHALVIDAFFWFFCDPGRRGLE
nr:NUDIX hydrolase [Candidatus Sigynarchaeota archaeon]